MLHKRIRFGMLVLISTLLGCAGSDSSVDSTGTPATALQPDAQPTTAAEAAQTAAKQPDARPGAIPSWAGKGDGEPFDVNQFLASRAAPEDNAAPLYLAALNQSRESGSLKDIGLLADVKKLQSGATSLQQVEQALKSAAPSLAQIDNAQTKPSCVFVTGIGIDVLLPHVQEARAIARASLVQLYWARANEDSELAASAIKRVLHLSRDLRPRGVLVSQLVSISLDGVVLSGIEEFTLNNPKLTTDQCDQVLALLVEHQQQGLDPYQEGLRMEYIMTRQAIEDVQAGRWTLKELVELVSGGGNGQLPFERINYEAEKAACNRIFAIAIREAQTPYHELAAASDSDAEIKKLLDEAKKGGAVVVLLLTPAVQAAREAATRAEANLAGVQLLTALRRYELAHGKLPASLDEAVADTVLKTVPVDPFSGQPMRFAIVNRKATVYSTGPDLKDDGGRIEWKFGNQPGDYLFAMGPLAGVRPRPTGDERKREPEEPTAPTAKTAQVRTWTSTIGTKLEAEFTGVEGEIALLKKPDGTVLRVPLEKLSEQDRAWIRQHVQE